MVFLTALSMLLAALAGAVFYIIQKDDDLRAARSFTDDQDAIERAIKGGGKR